MENGMTNQSTNSSGRVFGDNASPVFALFSITLSLWIVIANLFVVICFIKHRNHLVKNKFTLHVLTLSGNDFLVGLSTIPIYVTSFTANVGYELCIFRLVIFSTAQFVVLVHILGICFNRLFIVCRLSSPLKYTKGKGLIVILFILTWLVCTAIVAFPYGIWGKYRETVTICSMNEIFQENYKHSVLSYLSFFVIISALTNAVYVAIIVKLRFNSHKVHAGNSPSARNNSPELSKMNTDSVYTSNAAADRRKLYPLSIESCRVLETAQERNVPQVRKTPNKFHYYTTTGKVSSEPGMEFHRVSMLPITEMQSAETDNDSNDPGNASLQKSSKNYHNTSSNTTMPGQKAEEPRISPLEQTGKSMMKGQRNALVAIGLVLVMYDICTTPFIIMYLIEFITEAAVPRNWKLFTVVLLTFNSAINPFIYTWKFPSFRRAMAKTFRSMRCKE